MNNKLIVAAAGSGKTTHLINKSLLIQNQRILITTYTEANKNEIIKNFLRLITVFQKILQYRHGSHFLYSMVLSHIKALFMRVMSVD